MIQLGDEDCKIFRSGETYEQQVYDCREIWFDVFKNLGERCTRHDVIITLVLVTGDGLDVFGCDDGRPGPAAEMLRRIANAAKLYNIRFERRDYEWLEDRKNGILEDLPGTGQELARRADAQGEVGIPSRRYLEFSWNCS
jgi:hypothetical protein